MTKLNPRQRSFAKHYALTGVAAEAARQAGYSTINVDYPAVHGHRLIRNDKVQIAVDRERKRIAEQHEVTISEVLQLLRRAADIATTQDQSSALTGAALALAKVAGLITDKQETTVKHQSPQELAPKLLEMWEKSKPPQVTDAPDDGDYRGIAHDSVSVTHPDGDST